MLTCKNISKAFGNTQVLENIDFTVNAGEIHALIGANGSGKSTLVKIINGELLADSGSVLINGSETRHSLTGKREQLDVSKVSQDYQLYPNLSIYDNIVIGSAHAKSQILYRVGSFRKQINEIFQDLGTKLDIAQNVEVLSRAERQLVAIAKALFDKHSVVILDEPTAHLDTSQVKNLFKIVTALRKQNIAIVLITHELNDALAIADKVSLLKDRQLMPYRSDNNLSEDSSTKSKLKAVAYKEDFGKQRKKSHSSDGVFELKIDNCEKVWVQSNEIVSLHANDNSDVQKILERNFFNTESKYPLSTPIESIRSGVGFLPQDRLGDSIFPNLGVSENLAILILKKESKYGFIKRQKILKLVTDEIASLNIVCKSPEQPIVELSGGNQQKVIFARWRLADLKVLLLADPTSGVDAIGKKQIYSAIKDLTNTSHSIVLASYDINDEQDLADRIIILEKNKLKKEIVVWDQK